MDALSRLPPAAQARFNYLQSVRPVFGKALGGRLGGLRGAYERGRTESSWGRRMLACRGGQALARHNPLHVRTVAQRYWDKIALAKHAD